MRHSFHVAPLPASDVLKVSPWHVIQPEATTNLISNPSPQVALSGTTSNGVSTRVTTQARRGRYSQLVAPSSVLCRQEESRTGLTIGQVYTFSRDLYGEAGFQFELRIVSGSTTYTKSIIATGRWQRVWVSGVATQTSIVCTTAVVNHTKPFYIDGAQLEAKAYPTTYCDGNQVGFRSDDYAWSGIPYSSTSTRSALSSHGGRMLAFADLGAVVKAVAGLAFLTTTPITTPLTTGGAVVNAVNPDTTSFSLTVQYPEVKSEIERGQAMATMRQLLRPSPLGTGRVQPTMLMYEPQDDCGDQIGDRLWIPCYWEGDPIEQGAWPNSESVYNFTLYMPMMLGLNRVASLDSQATIASTNDLGLTQRRRDSNAWIRLNSSNDGTAPYVYAIEPRRNGGIFVGADTGRYFGGSLTVRGIVQFDGSTWSNVGPNMANGPIRAIATDAGGTIYVGGQHTNLAPLSPNIARWDGTSWNTLSSGTNGSVNAIAIAGDGRVFIGGSFTTSGGVSTPGVAVYNPQTNTFAALGSPGTGVTGGAVYSLAISPRGFLYVGGDFTAAGGVANTNGIAVWNILTSSWQSIGNVAPMTVLTVQKLLFGPDNRLYMGGQFTSVNGVTVNGLAMWNGAQWLPVGPVTGTSNVVAALDFDRDGLLYIGGLLSNNTLYPNQNLVRWNGSQFLPADMTWGSGSPAIQTVRSTAEGMYVGWGSQTTAVSGLFTSANTITNTSTMTISPVIRIVGSATSYTTITEIVNYTTGTRIFFNQGTFGSSNLLPNETLTITTTQGQVSVVSSVFGVQYNRVLNGSDLPLFKLATGANILGTLASRSDITITFEYQEAMASLDDTIWRIGR